jgi:hypothetical protein
MAPPMAPLLEHAQQVWELLPLPPGTYRHVFAKANDEVVGTWTPGPGALSRFTRLHSDWDCYIQLNPTRSRTSPRPHASDVSHVQAILIDVDPVGVGSTPVEQMMHSLGGLGVPADSVSIIDSGRGWQFWLHMEPIAIIGEGSCASVVRQFVRTVTRAFVSEGWRVDTRCSDLARLARLPGTVNQKTGRLATLVQGGTPVPSLYLLRLEPDEAFEPVPGSPPEIARWVDVASRLNASAYAFITEGVEEPGRHGACWMTATSLREAGALPALALSLLRIGASRCRPKLPASEVNRPFKQVYGR